MNLKGEYQLGYPRQAVWEALLDPDALARTLPGCESLVRTADNTFAGRLKVAIGPVRGVFAGTLVLTDLAAPTGYRMRLEGRGPSGFMTGEGRVDLDDVDGGTRLRYDLEATVGGKLAGVGQRVLDSSARAVAQQGLIGLDRVLRALSQGGDVGPSEPAVVAEAGGASAAVAQPGSTPERRTLPPPPSQAEFAMSVARATIADLVPKEQRLAIVTLVIFVFGLLTGFVLGKKR